MLCSTRGVVAAQRRAFGSSKVLRELKPGARLSWGEVQAAQAMRTVSKVTPGKFFMVNFIAGEQSIMSIANRVNSVFIVGLGALVVMLFWGSAIKWSWLTSSAMVFGVVSMHYHMGNKGSVPLAALLVLAFIYKCHIEGN
eukprot:TRINITY_DN3986_c0_g1_i1.p1 TRINITY_DN3986_c0_g1~~TRINITY_DN3986_c0_g1_i1.p1  ORF type:complete len:140 (+),score=19.09 TRINITY_DN3986_c0_g1_i1:49-468(+)